MEDPRNLKHELSAIETDLNELSACAPDPDSMNAWLSTLPMANLAAASTHLLALVSELPRLRTDFLTRLELLEAVRPTVYYICARVDRQSAALGIRWNDALEDAQTLQRTLALGYKSVVLAALPVAADERSAREAFLVALHRSLSDLAHVNLRFTRHYLAPEPGHWLHLNQLFHIGRTLGFAEHKVKDPESHHPVATTITDAWLRPALLAISRPNQLRGNELSQLFNALEQWSSQATVVTEPTTGSWSVDLEVDQPPLPITASGGSEQTLTFSTEVLAYELEAFLQEIPGSVPVPDYVSEKLLRHLSSSVWSKRQTRSHRRLVIADDVEVGIGLRVASNCFAREMEERHPQPPQATATPPDRPPLTTHQTRAFDTSPLGFRVLWPDGLPPAAQIGEIVAVRERTNGGGGAWRVGVLRWIGGNRNGTAVTGIELLAPTAVPISARVVRTKGGITGFAKALLLPAIPSQNRPASMITPRVPFQAMQKIQIQRGRMQSNVHLGQCMGQTENYNQFAFRMLGSYLENRVPGQTMVPRSNLPGAERPTNGN